MKVKKMVLGFVVVFGVIMILSSLSVLCWAQTEANPMPVNPAAGWAYLGAAIAAGLGALGAGIAVSSVASAAIGAISEKPELIGKTFIYVGLAEGIAIYGLIIAIMILGKV